MASKPESFAKNIEDRLLSMRKLNKFTILLSLILFVGFSACKKDIQNDNPLPTTTTVSPNFDWDMKHDVDFTLKNTEGKLITIAPVGSEDAYIKMMCQENTYTTSIKMAKSIENISINGNTVAIVNGLVDYTMPNDFKSVTSATQALSFDERDEDYITTGDPSIDAYPFTMECWIKTGGTTSNTDMVIMSYCNSGEDGWQMGVMVDKDGANNQGELTVRVRKAPSGGGIEGKDNTVVTDNEWHHIAVVFDSATRRTLYLDGVEKLVDTRESPIDPIDSDNFAIGTWFDVDPKSYFHGTIDEVRLWNTARTSSQINYYMTRSVNAGSTGLVGYWDMEEGSGLTTANQTATAGLDGSLLSANYGGNEAPEAPNWEGDIDSDSDGVINTNDDYPHDATRAFNNYWPATPYTLAFEDLWPSMGDYDLNDMVVGYRFNRVTNASNNLVEVFGAFTLEAAGASLGKGFGFELADAGIQNADFDVVVPAAQKAEGYITYNANGTEAGQDNAVIIAHELMPNIGNTRDTYTGNRSYNIQIDMVAADKLVDYFDFQNWNPFFIIKVGHPTFDRRHEVHLPGYTPTSIAATWNVGTESVLFDSINDGSDYPTGGPGGSLWYKTNESAQLWSKEFGQYFPWGLDIPKEFEWAIEADEVHTPPTKYRFTLTYGYGQFEGWASSNGTQNLDWYDHITDQNFIFDTTP